MIRLDTGTPGAGKTLINVRDIVTLEKDNSKNINLNVKIYESNLKIITEKNLLDEFEYVIRKVGQGVVIRDEYTRFEQNYFDLFKETDRKEDYFQRSIFYNEIIQRVNTDHSLNLNKLRPVRTIYTNIAGLELENTRPIPEDADWRKCPDGSYIVIDEIQNVPIFSSESRAIDPIVKDLTIHRHRGFDIIGITQFPELVHKNFRAVTGHHRHLVNSFGLKRSTQYEWSTVKIDPNAFKNKATAEIKTTFAFPKDLYKYYKSSTVHTHKLRLPIRFLMIMGLILTLIFGLFMCSVSNDKNLVTQIATGKTGEKSDSQNHASNSAGVKSSTQNAMDLSLECRKAINVEKPECVKWFNDLSTNKGSVSGQTPQTTQVSYNPNKPFDSAEIQKNLTYEVTQKPVFSGCMKKGTRYIAYTQQGTILNDVSQNDCLRLMNNGDRPFDYFKKESNNAQLNNQGNSKDNIQQTHKQPVSQEIANNQVESHLQAKITNGANDLAGFNNAF